MYRVDYSLFCLHNPLSKEDKDIATKVFESLKYIFEPERLFNNATQKKRILLNEFSCSIQVYLAREKRKS